MFRLSGKDRIEIFKPPWLARCRDKTAMPAFDPLATVKLDECFFPGTATKADHDTAVVDDDENHKRAPKTPLGRSGAWACGEKAVLGAKVG